MKGQSEPKGRFEHKAEEEPVPDFSEVDEARNSDLRNLRAQRSMLEHQLRQITNDKGTGRLDLVKAEQKALLLSIYWGGGPKKMVCDNFLLVAVDTGKSVSITEKALLLAGVEPEKIAQAKKVTESQYVMQIKLDKSLPDPLAAALKAAFELEMAESTDEEEG